MSETLSYTYIPPPAGGMAEMLQRSTDLAFIPCDLENSDYLAFYQQVADGIVQAPPGWTGPIPSGQASP